MKRRWFLIVGLVVGLVVVAIVAYQFYLMRKQSDLIRDQARTIKGYEKLVLSRDETKDFLFQQTEMLLYALDKCYAKLPEGSR